MQLFHINETVIDTRSHDAVVVVAIIPQGPNSMMDLYVLRRDGGEYYISDYEDLIVYDKHYWDNIDTLRINEVLD